MRASYGIRWRARGDHSPSATPRQPFHSFFLGERAAQARAIWLSLLVFSLCRSRLSRDESISLSAALSHSLPALSLSRRFSQRLSFAFCVHCFQKI